MPRSRFLLPLLLSIMAAGCAAAPAGVTVTDVAPTDVPAEVAAVARAAAPGLTITEAQLKVREGRRYFDVGGVLPDGQEIELDLLQGASGWAVVEIQRDIAWSDAPAAVRAAAPNANPVRVIESRQTDGSVVYELFAPNQPGTPALEVMLKDGAATVLKEAWPH